MSTIDKINSINALKNAQQVDGVEETGKEEGGGFAGALKGAISDLNTKQEIKDKALSDIATGNVKNLHQAAIAIDKAEISMKMALEIRNKALSAYKEILRTQV
jgi:flagellar hook-basal body complex protein FliE